MKQAATLKDFTPDTLLPGVKINTSATDFAPLSQLQMMRFKGEKWELFGDIISGDIVDQLTAVAQQRAESDNTETAFGRSLTDGDHAHRAGAAC